MKQGLRSVPILSQVGGPLDPDDAAALPQLRTLEAVLAFLRARPTPLNITDIVTQDEFTHDVIVEVLPGLVWVFDTT